MKEGKPSWTASGELQRARGGLEALAGLLRPALAQPPRAGKGESQGAEKTEKGLGGEGEKMGIWGHWLERERKGSCPGGEKGKYECTEGKRELAEVETEKVRLP